MKDATSTSTSSWSELDSRCHIIAKSRWSPDVNNNIVPGSRGVGQSIVFASTIVQREQYEYITIVSSQVRFKKCTSTSKSTWVPCYSLRVRMTMTKQPDIDNLDFRTIPLHY